MNDDHEILASAYVDGELTDDEARAAEADPAVMAEVEQLRATRSMLADAATAPSPGAKQAALAAAMAEFRTLHAEPTAAADATVTSLATARERRAWRWVSAAAAVVGVGLAGVVISRATLGDDDDASEVAVDVAADADTAAEEPAEAFLEESAADEAGDAGPAAAEEAAEEPASEPADDMAEEPAEEAADESEADDEPAEGDDAGDEVAVPEEGGDLDGSRSTLTDLIPDDVVGRTVERPITSDDDLIDFARAMGQAAADDVRGDVGDRARACDVDEPLVADAYVDVGDEVVDAVVALEPDLLLIRAIDPVSCLELLTV